MHKSAAAALKRVAELMGLDRAVSFVLSSRAFTLFASPVTLILVVSTLTEVEQGFYYAFSALTGVSILMELGLGVVLTQFASHEYARLRWSPDGRLQGDSVALHRVLAMLRKALLWYGAISLLLVIILIPLGAWMFTRKPESLEVNYLLPWIVFMAGFAFGTFLIPLLAVLEGCGMVAEVQRIRFFQVMASPLVVWPLLIGEFKLYAAACEMLASSLILGGWIAVRYSGLLRQTLTLSPGLVRDFSWKREVLPMQWRIAVSWVCAYFTSFLFVPLVFEYRGAAEAGQLGMSLKLTGIIYLLSNAWIATQAPVVGRVIAEGRISEAGRLARTATLRALFAGACLSVALVLGIGILAAWFPRFDGRTLSLWGLAFLCLTNLGNIVTTGISSYLRAFKEEPLMQTAAIVAVVSAATVFTSAKWFDAEVLAAALLIVTVLIFVPLHVRVLAAKETHRRLKPGA